MARQRQAGGARRRAAPADSQVPPPMDPRFLDRVRQVQWDHYYMDIARTIATRANCTGSRVGAVLVAGNRIISTGFNGTPAGFQNCLDGGCVRCRDRALAKANRVTEMSDRSLAKGPKQLDVCICVHAEANALLAAARAGTQTDDSVLYTTYKPCFTCLKEAIQAGVRRVVYLNDYEPSDNKSLLAQYEILAEHLRDNDARNFEMLSRQRDLLKGTSTPVRDPDLDRDIHAPLDAEAKPSVRRTKKTSTSASASAGRASTEKTVRRSGSQRASSRAPKSAR